MLAPIFGPILDFAVEFPFLTFIILAFAVGIWWQERKPKSTRPLRRHLNLLTDPLPGDASRGLLHAC